MTTMIKVRIPIAVDPTGRWYAYGWNNGKDFGPRNFDELMEVTSEDTIGQGEAHFWITAELPIPEASEIAGSVEPATVKTSATEVS